MSQSEALVPEIFNVTLTDADTEYSQALSKGTKFFSVQCRTAFDVRFAFEADQVDTPGSNTYATVKSNQAYNTPEKVGWSWTSSVETSPTIYLASSEAAVVVELICWKDIRD